MGRLLICRLVVRTTFGSPLSILFLSLWLSLWLLLHHVFVLVDTVDDRLDLRGFGVELAHSGV